MDDSLSDTQQEKKQMSVKELVLKTSGNTKIEIAKDDDEIEICINDERWYWLDRNQAHLLMLYLQEHLGYVSISKDRLDD